MSTYYLTINLGANFCNNVYKSRKKRLVYGNDPHLCCCLRIRVVISAKYLK